MDREAFFQELRRKVDQVYSDAWLAGVDRRSEPWLTGYLGDPFSQVWFVAENPSLSQSRKVSDEEPSSERQWTMSKGDHLFREALHKHGLKENAPMCPGGWRCYITDVIKSAAVVKEFQAMGAAGRWRLAQAWAPVFGYELLSCRPPIIVFVGKSAKNYTRRLIRAGLLPDPKQDWDAQIFEIPHYVYVTARPDNVRKLKANDPVRRAEYLAQFASIAAARDALPVGLALEGGGQFEVGNRGDFDAARATLRSILQYGSDMGRFADLSALAFGGTEIAFDHHRDRHIGHEAKDLIERIDRTLLDPPTVRILGRLAQLGIHPLTGSTRH